MIKLPSFFPSCQFRNSVFGGVTFGGARRRAFLSANAQFTPRQFRKFGIYRTDFVQSITGCKGKQDESMSNWNEQWKRVQRYYDRCKKINDGFKGHGEPSDYYFDDMVAFFQNCFHLRDWLMKDGFQSAKIAKTPEEYVRDTLCLAICADLANTTKHMNLRHRPKSGDEPKRANRSMSVTMGSPVVILKANIEHNGKMIDAFELSTECMSAWSAYL